MSMTALDDQILSVIAASNLTAAERLTLRDHYWRVLEQVVRSKTMDHVSEMLTKWGIATVTLNGKGLQL
jgi:hypothetical protein